MRLFDSHCHLDDRAYDGDLDAVFHRMDEANVRALMIVGIHRKSAERAAALARTHPGCYASVGVHPHDVKNCTEAALEALTDLARRPEVRAWGETGLDFNRMFSPRKDQERWFAEQMDRADDLDLPLILHERDSNGRLLAMLRGRYPSGRRGVVHCFSGDDGDLAGYLSLGFSIGVTGILTHKQRGEGLRRMVRDIPAERLLVETDAPYLTPTPERNKVRRNEPAFVRTVLLKLAEVRGVDPEPLAETIWNNTCRLFRVDPPGP